MTTKCKSSDINTSSRQSPATCHGSRLTSMTQKFYKGRILEYFPHFFNVSHDFSMLQRRKKKNLFLVKSQKTFRNLLKIKWDIFKSEKNFNRNKTEEQIKNERKCRGSWGQFSIYHQSFCEKCEEIRISLDTFCTISINFNSLMKEFRRCYFKKKKKSCLN